MDHYFYARSVSLGQILPYQIEGGRAGAGGWVTTTDQTLVKIFNDIRFKPKVKVTEGMLSAARHLPSGSTVLQNYWGAAVYPPTAYVVPAAALFAAVHLKFDPLASFYAGRIANAVIYVLIGALAIRITPTAKYAFALILLLPMSLSQAGSFSADAHVLPMSALVCALFAREARRGLPAISGLLISTLLLISVATTKPPMVALVLPLIAIGWRRSRVLAALLGTIVILAFTFWTIEFLMTNAQAARVATLHRDVSSARQIELLLSSPLSVMSIAINTLELYGLSYVQGLIGIFGWLDTPLDTWFYVVALFCISGVAFLTMGDEPTGYQLIFLLSALLASAFTFGALYVTWNKVGSDIILGVQGRYFIPALFPSAIALAGITRCGKASSVIALAPVVVLWGLSSVYVPLALVERFYLH
jgi:uncharacterized membrane protein